RGGRRRADGSTHTRRGASLPDVVQIAHSKRNGPSGMDLLRNVEKHAIAKLARVVQPQNRHLGFIDTAEVLEDSFPTEATHGVLAGRVQLVLLARTAAGYGS